jgi:hypothetical protein
MRDYEDADQARRVSLGGRSTSGVCADAPHACADIWLPMTEAEPPKPCRSKRMRSRFNRP